MTNDDECGWVVGWLWLGYTNMNIQAKIFPFLPNANLLLVKEKDTEKDKERDREKEIKIIDKDTYKVQYSQIFYNLQKDNVLSVMFILVFYKSQIKKMNQKWEIPDIQATITVAIIVKWTPPVLISIKSK